MNVFRIVVVASFLFSLVQAQCDSLTTCNTCTGQTGCGWCAATKKCLAGGPTGPSDSTFCFGAWNYGANSCPSCNSFTDCRQCQNWKSDCSWCLGSQNNPPTCQDTNFFGCNVATTCPCDFYSTCSSCVNTQGCGWCEASGSCTKTTGGTCQLPTLQSCPCGLQFNCQQCNADFGGCLWCEASGTCIPKTNSTICPIPHDGHSCNQYCLEQGTTCEGCNSVSGCGWCRATSTCVDISVSECMYVHNCPNCPAMGMCSDCLATEGCNWCSNTETCAAAGAANCNPIASCNAYCGLYSDCRTCARKKGCGWCETSSVCVDSSVSSCLLAHTCATNQECGGFDGGSFVGGMFLVIGIIALSVGGYIFYRWRVGKRVTYTELR